MTNVYTLDTLKAEIEQKYAPVEIDLGDTKVVLRNMMRLRSKERDAVMAAIETSNSAETDTAAGVDVAMDALRDVIRTVAERNGDLLVDAIGDDLALAMRIMEVWTEGTQPGEAQNSPA